MALSLRDPPLLKDRCLIGGAWVGRSEVDVIDPGTGARIAAVPNFGADETQQAIQVAEAALAGWLAGADCGATLSDPAALV